MTRKVRFFKIYDCYNNYDEDSCYKFGDGVGEWEEISDEDFKFIQENMWRIRKYLPDNQFVMVEQAALGTAKETFTSIKNLVDKERKEAEAYARKQEEEKKKRAMKLELKKVKTRQALYEQLKKEFENQA